MGALEQIDYISPEEYLQSENDRPDEGLNKVQSLTIVDPYNIPMLKGMKDT